MRFQFLELGGEQWADTLCDLPGLRVFRMEKDTSELAG